MKQCIQCNEVKSYDFFQIAKVNKDGYTGRCKSCIAEYNKKKYEINKKHYKKIMKKYREENKEKLKEINKKYYEENKKEIKQKQKKYYEENKEKVNEYKKEWEKERRKTDNIYRFKCNVRNNVFKSFKRGTNQFRKEAKTEKILGCTIEEFRIYIESKFKKGMTFENYGEWHLDHIVPVFVAKNEDEVVKLCHYTNYQPLWAEDNLSKGCKIEEIQLKIL